MPIYSQRISEIMSSTSSSSSSSRRKPNKLYLSQQIQNHFIAKHPLLTNKEISKLLNEYIHLFFTKTYFSKLNKSQLETVLTHINTTNKPPTTNYTREDVGNENYRITINDDSNTNIKQFVESQGTNIKNELLRELGHNLAFKVSAKLYYNAFNIKSNDFNNEAVKVFQTEKTAPIISTYLDIQQYYKDILSITTSLYERGEYDSQVILTSNKIEFSIYKGLYQGASYSPIPKVIEMKNAIINVKNKENRSLLYYIAAGL